MYHARTVKAYRKFVAFAVVCTAANVASAQSAEGETPSAWPTYPSERHIIGRLMGGAGLRLNDAYGAGLNTPPYVLVDGQFLFLNAGNIHMGPTVGVHLGFNSGHADGVQTGIVPGWSAHWRLARPFALTARFGLPIVITRGLTTTQAVDDPRNNSSVMYTPAQAPVGSTTEVGLGFELGVGGIYYITSGIGVTAEINGGLYLGNSFYTFPYVGGAVGLVIDYELLP